MSESNLNDFIKGYNQLNVHRFDDLSYAEVLELMTEYGEIDPVISHIIHDAYVHVKATHQFRAPVTAHG